MSVPIGRQGRLQPGLFSAACFESGDDLL